MTHVHERPIWKRVGSGARSSFYRFVTVAERVARWRDDTLLPPAHLRVWYYNTLRPSAFAHACETARAELLIHGLRPEHRVLDIGSGIGNLAIGLAGYLTGSYDGVDVHPEAVAWCREAITPRYPTFRFHRADVSSEAYNPRGAAPASAYRFPFADRTFDFIFLSSVFTHMLPEAVEHYLHEIARLLAPNGVSVASYFLLDDEARAAVEQGRSFMSFDVTHPSRLYRLHDATVPEAAVALEESFVRGAHRRAGLRIRDMRRGRWWSGAAHDQDVIAAVRDDESG